MKPSINVLMALLIALCVSQLALGQKDSSRTKRPDYSKDPHWIQMMDDPNVNYHEAVQAFEEFWEKRGEPEEEEEGEKKEVKRSLLSKLLKSDEKLKEENSHYLIDYKKFRQWKRDMEPYVQPDGSILSKEEQLRIWENSRK